jgi:predicted ATPase/DNA-binding XRE family transcriptional regulator
MKPVAPASFAARLKQLRETAGFTQEELATIAGLSVHAVSALERGERRRPHPETVRALSAALDLSGPARDALLSSARAPAHDDPIDRPGSMSLPLPVTALVGRDADVEALRQWLVDPAARLITLIGPGGVGKTRLALEVARRISEDGAVRAAFLPLAAIRETVYVASAIAEALGLPDVGAADLARRARLACDGRPVLLVLDNFEQVLEAASLVTTLLAGVPSLRFLVTSRAALRVRGEREYAVGPLVWDPGPKSTTPADRARAPAVRLFLERVRDVQPEFRLTPANASTVTAICRRLDALPLALELAAPWIKVLSPEALLRRLEYDVLLSTAAPRDVPERQQTMNATIAWSYQLLDDDERRAFRRLGALPGLFPIDAAAEVLAGRDGATDVSDAALRAVAGLVDKSLLIRAETSVVPTCPLYHMLETVRAYAVLELTAAAERDDAMEGLVRYCLAESGLAAEGLIGPGQIEWLDRVREDLESYRAVLAWLVERGRAGEAAEISWRLMFFWLIRGRGAEGLQWYERILDLPSLAPAVESRTLTGAAALWYSRGELARANTALTRALQLAQDCGDQSIAVHAELVFAHVDQGQGNGSAACERFTRSVAGFRSLGIPWGAGNALSGMALAMLGRGDARGAEQLLDEASVVLRDAGPWFRSLVLDVRAILAIRRGDPDAALACLREGLLDIRELHDTFAFVNSLVPLAAAAVLKGNDAWAARILAIGRAVTERTGAAVVDKPLDALREQTEQEVRARLGPDRWQRAGAAGRTTSIDALIADIDQALGEPKES